MRRPPFTRPTYVLWILMLLIAIPGRAADPEKGKATFAKCAACHTLRAELKNVLGPTLEGVFGRRAGSRDDYRYSPAMRRSTITWTPDTIGGYLADPQEYIRNNRMPFEGIRDATERENLIAYLAQATKVDAAKH